MEVIGGIFVLAIVTGIIAETKGRSGLGWFFLGLILPVVAIFILVLVMPKTKRQRLADKATDLLEQRRLETLSTEELHIIENGQSLPRKK